MTLLQDTVCLPPKENLLEVLVNVITLQVTQSECTGYYYLKYITENTVHIYETLRWTSIASRGEEVGILLQSQTKVVGKVVQVNSSPF